MFSYTEHTWSATIFIHSNTRSLSRVMSVISAPYVLDCHESVSWIHNTLDMKCVPMVVSKMVCCLITLDVFIHRTYIVCNNLHSFWYQRCFHLPLASVRSSHTSRTLKLINNSKNMSSMILYRKVICKKYIMQ